MFDLEAKTRSSFPFGERTRHDECVRNVDRLNGVENVLSPLRGHLKSSHIADKRKNFHMALYPLPPSSNESVIDNGRNVWQMPSFTSKIVFDDSQRRSPNARYRSKVPASNEKSSFFVSTCSNNVVCLTHAGTPPWRFCVHCEKNKETISNSRRRIHVRFLFFLFFCMLKSRWPV